MPYYCTVPRCTSMAGKNKNVSFHQFPRDEELAKLWNKILKRGKPYTKYSKVCSLHFTSEDYTVTSGQKNKGSWRTLRKNAIPSRNLPSDWPSLHQSQSSSQTPPPAVLDPRMHQQMAQAIYVQTMLAMQAASIISVAKPEETRSDCDSTSERSETASPTNSNEQTVNQDTENVETRLIPKDITIINKTTYKCIQCSKCFKDPDVFLLHQRTHTRHVGDRNQTRQNTLLANPILANLLGRPESSRTNAGVFNINNVNSIENQIMMALAANMENYLQNLDSIMTPLSFMETVIENGVNADDRETDNRSECQNSTNYIDNEESNVEDNKSIDSDSSEAQMVIDENNETQVKYNNGITNETISKEEHSHRYQEKTINNVDDSQNNPLKQEECQLTENTDLNENKENHEDLDMVDCEISNNKIKDIKEYKSVNGVSNNYRETTLIGN